MLDAGSTHPRNDFEFRISNFEFAARHSPDTVDLAVLATRSKPAPSTPHNQPRVNKINTPTSRKVAAGPARRGFPRAGGWGVGAGRRSEPGTWVTLKPGTWVTLLLCGTEVDRAVEGNDAHA